MKLLLDTHVLVWWMFDAPELPAKARAAIADPENVIFVSAASIWELQIKSALGKINLPANFDEILTTEAFENLAVTWAHAHAIRALPPHHKDPFDRMLIAQARCEKLVLLTHDKIVKQYDVEYLLA